MSGKNIFYYFEDGTEFPPFIGILINNCIRSFINGTPEQIKLILDFEKSFNEKIEHIPGIFKSCYKSLTKYNGEAKKKNISLGYYFYLYPRINFYKKIKYILDCDESEEKFFISFDISKISLKETYKLFKFYFFNKYVENMINIRN